MSENEPCNPDALERLRATKAELAALESEKQRGILQPTPEWMKTRSIEEQVWTEFMTAAMSNAATTSMSPEWFGIAADKFLDEWRKRWAAK